jgi:hypothetical protein
MHVTMSSIRLTMARFPYSPMLSRKAPSAVVACKLQRRWAGLIFGCGGAEDVNDLRGHVMAGSIPAPDAKTPVASSQRVQSGRSLSSLCHRAQAIYASGLVTYVKRQLVRGMGQRSRLAVQRADQPLGEENPPTRTLSTGLAAVKRQGDITKPRHSASPVVHYRRDRETAMSN